ncbi:unnamed protein product [Mycena citricolor]|uniref:Uncharacterized protein n=1 Tax=Mycena citricolor TaxID=2018698 RepID=A0AAD2HBK4_9AGAR|nr:unnamed protein product [Mycena citricolor]CAK5271882.1 unnamed protein product [Mycena citricolor]
MSFMLPVLSFVCAGLLAVFLVSLLRQPTINTANVALVLWLLFGNIVHAVNAIVWAHGTDVNLLPVWCDIVTKLLLGVNVAVPGVCLCSARYLELLSSKRRIFPNSYSQRLHTLFDIALCYVLPVLYLALHFAVQDYRYDLVQGLGCSASIFRSIPTVLLMILPPLLLCIISLVLCAFAVYRLASMSKPRFSEHISSRTAISYSMFIRRLIKSALLTLCVTAVTCLPLAGPMPYSLSQFSQSLGDVSVVTQRWQVRVVELVWWSIPAMSIVYLLLSVLLGDGYAQVVSWLRLKTGSSNGTVPRSPVLALPMTSPPTPVSIQLRSGWDGMLDLECGRPKQPGKTLARLSVLLPTQRKSVSEAESSDSSSDGMLSRSSSKASLPPINTRSLARSPSSSAVSSPEDEAFLQATLTYLASPVAQRRGTPTPLLSTPVLSPNPSLSPDPRSPVTPRSRPTTPLHPLTNDLEQLPLKPRHVEQLKPKPQQSIPEDTASTCSSIWDAPWPLPPLLAPPPAVPPLRLKSDLKRPMVKRSPSIYSHAVSRAHSPTSSVSTIVPSAYAPSLYIPVLGESTTPPFEGSGSAIGSGCPKRAARGETVFITRTVEAI